MSAPVPAQAGIAPPDDGDGMFEGREWFAQPGASPETLGALREAAPAALPESYYRLLAFSDGGEGALPVDPYNLCLDSAAEVRERIARGHDEDPDLSGFLIFGSNGGGEHIAFDLRNGAPWPIVYIDMIAGYGSVAPLTPSFDALLDIIGIDSED